MLNFELSPIDIWQGVFLCLKDCVLLERRLEAAYFPLKGPGRGGREFKGDTKGTRESGWPGAPYYQDQDSYSFIQLPTAT